MPLRVTILGGTGFIGEYLNKKLSRLKNININIIFKKDLPEKKFPKTIYTRFDSSEDILIDTDCLVILTQPDRQLIKKILKKNKASRIIYVSTLLLYGDSKKPQNEESPIIPINDYEKGKSEEEKMLANLLKNSETKLTIVRLTNVYGDIKNRGIIQKIFNAILNDQTLTINNKGEQIRDYIFIDDVAKYLSFLVLYDQKIKMEVFNIATGVGTPISRLIKKIEALTKKRLSKKDDTNLLEKKSIIGDNRKIIKLTGFKPKFNLDLGLKKTYQNLSKI